MAVLSLARVEARLKVSADESSRRVWETTGSGGFGGLNYYFKGAILGAFLDLAIRGHSQGRHSLDDVMVQLYNETKPPKPGFSETRIRELCVKFAGPELGPLYDEAVMHPGEVPFDKVLPLVGLKLGADGLVEDEAAPEAALAIGRAWPR